MSETQSVDWSKWVTNAVIVVAAFVMLRAIGNIADIVGPLKWIALLGGGVAFVLGVTSKNQPLKDIGWWVGLAGIGLIVAAWVNTFVGVMAVLLLLAVIGFVVWTFIDD